MKEFYNEKVDFMNPLLYMKIRNDDDQSIDLRRMKEVPWHYHKEVELLLVTEGELEVELQNSHFLLQAGELLIIGSSEPHRTRISKPCQKYLLQFDLQQYLDTFMLPFFPYFNEWEAPLSECNAIWRRNPQIQQELKQAILQIWREFSRKEFAYEVAISMHIKHILLQVIRCRSDIWPADGKIDDLLILQPVLAYIEKELAGTIQLEDASRMANMNYSHFSKFFKRTIGMPFTVYVNQKRIKKAERLLLTRSCSIAHIAVEVGIPNLAHFYKLFERYHEMTPKQFVDQHMRQNVAIG